MTLGQKKEMIGNGMTSEGQMFSQQEMSVAIKKMKENKAADGSGDCKIPESTGNRRSRETKRLDEWNIEWSRYP